MSYSFGREGRQTYHATAGAVDRDGNRAAARHNNSGIAHVWAQGRYSFGRTGNGNLYFHGPALYSYGSHYVAGYILPALDAAANWQPGVALLNADSYSVSTSQHVGDAASAARHRSPLWVPNLTELARVLESCLVRAAGSVDAAGFPLAINRKELARDAAARLKAHFSTPGNLPSDSRNWRVSGEDSAGTVAAIFRAFGCDAPERRAAAAVKAAEIAARKAAEGEAAKEKADALAYLARVATYDPAAVLAEIARDAREFAPSYRGGGKYGPPVEWQNKGKRVFRAIKAGKAAGRLAQCRAASAVRKAILTAPAAFESAAIRHNRAAVWGRNVKAIRAAVALANGGPLPRATGGQGRDADGFRKRADVLAEGVAAASALTDFLAAWAAPRARVAGVNPVGLAARLSGVADVLRVREERARRRWVYESHVGEVRALRIAIRAHDAPAGALPPANLIADMEPGLRVARGYAGRVPQSWDRGAELDSAGLLRPYSPAPRGWRAAGFTPARFKELADSLDSAVTAAKAELKARAEADKAAALAESFRLWREGRPVPRELPAMPRTDSAGCAYVRARDVERDAAGAIVGGVLETSQGATVPLAHAVRVFRFLKACRERGQGWQANGRTLPVGHFRVDRVESDGGFRAGCHKFAWAEIARLADVLGLADVAAADTTEGTPAHV